MSYDLEQLYSRMFPDYSQPVPVAVVGENASSAEPPQELTTPSARYAAALSFVDEFYRNIAERTSSRSFPRLGGSGLMVRGEFWTLSTSEFPNADEGYSASFLTETLESPEDWLQRNPTMHYQDWLNYIQKFYLSATACRGILRRATNRGMTLPPILQQALDSVANQE